MPWKVKAQSPDGTVSETIKDDLEAAFALRNEFKAKGFWSWIENASGKIIG
jgi:hypothetical protein